MSNLNSSTYRVESGMKDVDYTLDRFRDLAMTVLSQAFTECPCAFFEKGRDGLDRIACSE
jgi:hypothetical protein